MQMCTGPGTRGTKAGETARRSMNTMIGITPITDMGIRTMTGAMEVIMIVVITTGKKEKSV